MSITHYREATEGDCQFIVSGWSASYRMSRDVALLQMSDYADVMRGIVRAVLARPRTRTIIAHGEMLRGFISFEPSSVGASHIVHYIYVAMPYRGHGIARGLFDAAEIDPIRPFDYSCRTRASWELRSKAPLAIYNPLRARFAEEERPNEQRKEGPIVEYRRARAE